MEKKKEINLEKLLFHPLHILKKSLHLQNLVDRRSEIAEDAKLAPKMVMLQVLAIEMAHSQEAAESHWDKQEAELQYDPNNQQMVVYNA